VATTDPSAAFFEQLGSRGREPMLDQANGSIRFDLVDGARTTRWLVELDKGQASVSHKNARADCVVRGDRALFDRIVTGKENDMAAFLRGEISVEGDSELLVLIRRLFAGPARRKAKR
jgi:putative sterol carrier protein